MLTLLLADDHQLFRKGLRQLCELNGGFTVVAEAENGEQAIALARQHRPDVILMDIRMPGINGVEAVKEIMRTQPTARILILTMYGQEYYVINALRAGACGYLLKKSSEETLFAAIRAAHEGHGWIDSAIASTVVAHLGRPNSDQPDPELLNPSEREIVRLVAQGLNNESIAAQLHLSTGTVGNRLREIYSKLGVENRTGAALYALRNHWVSLDPEE
jgi:DNA-binding NarL/FixJ family response regulator